MAEIKKFLDQAGTSYLWSKIKTELDKKATNVQVTAIDNRLTTAEGKIATLEAGIYDDTEIRGLINTNATAIATEEARATEAEGALSDRLDDAEDALDVLTGGSSVEGSVAYQIAQIVAGADASYDTLKEIADWIINDTAGVGALNTRITNNTTAIDALEALVGDKSVATQIAEAIDAEDLDKYALASDLATLAGRVTSIEGLGITSAKVAAWDAVAAGSYDTEGAAAQALADAKAFASGLAVNYATAAQGAKADTALQPNDVIGLTNSEIDTAIANSANL